MKAIVWQHSTVLHEADVDARQNGKQWTVILPAGTLDADDLLQLGDRMLVNRTTPTTLPDGRVVADMYDPREGPP